MSKPKKKSSNRPAARTKARQRKSTGSSRKRSNKSSQYFPDEPLLFGKKQYILLGIGFALVATGILLMSGGSMPSPDVWDESIIYSFRRITLAPIVILSGFGVIMYGILKR